MNQFVILGTYEERLRASNLSARDAFAYSVWAALFLKQAEAGKEDPSSLGLRIESFVENLRLDFGCTNRELSECKRALNLLSQVMQQQSAWL